MAKWPQNAGTRTTTGFQAGHFSQKNGQMATFFGLLVIFIKIISHIFRQITKISGQVATKHIKLFIFFHGIYLHLRNSPLIYRHFQFLAAVNYTRHYQVL